MTKRRASGKFRKTKIEISFDIIETIVALMIAGLIIYGVISQVIE